MREDLFRKILKKIKKGSLSVEDALQKFKHFTQNELDFATIDHHRSLRKGFPEVIFCQGKTIDQIKKIVNEMKDFETNILLTRANEEIFQKLHLEGFPGIYYPIPKIILINPDKDKNHMGVVSVVCAGTADLPVAEEAAIVAEIMGNKVNRYNDIGVAGLHRLLSKIESINNADVIIVVAGMEGALPSVVGGLVDKPVVAVPTSIGYGTNLNGITPLLSMLNSCSAGITVVNIDNGFGAGYFASMITRTFSLKLNSLNDSDEVDKNDALL